jgi:hypothetical protein
VGSSLAIGSMINVSFIRWGRGDGRWEMGVRSKK